jgi:hypothetical protein
MTALLSPRASNIPAKEARLALASHLVALAKAGTLDEGALVARDLAHLISLTPAAPDISA